MIVYRLHKYDPRLYDDSGRYTGADWTHVTDIGRRIGGRVVTRAEYTRVEDAYVAAIDALLQAANVHALKIYSDSGLLRDVNEDQGRLFGLESVDFLAPKGGDWIQGDCLSRFCRLCLRDVRGYALSNDVNFFLCFTGGFYVHVGCESVPESAIRIIRELGLQLEPRGTLGDQALDNEFYRELIPHGEGGQPAD